MSIPSKCPNCGSEANWDWYDGGEALNYEADDLMGCANCGHVAEVDRERDDEGSVDLGPCCVCETTEGVRNILTLHKRSPTPGRGWGCVQCDLPFDGAVAVVCDGCFTEPLKFACKGYPATDGRVPFDSLEGYFEHDMSKHPEVVVM